MLKKILAGAISMVMAASVLAVGASAASVKKGDIDGSGSVDIEDAVGVIGYVNGNQTLSNSALKAGDVDKSGSVDIEDAVKVISAINGVNPLPEDEAQTTASTSSAPSSVMASMINGSTDVTSLDVDAEYADPSWDSTGSTDGEFAVYFSDADAITFSAFCISSDSFKTKSVKELVNAHLSKMVLDGMDLVSEKETTFNGYEAYSMTYKFHFVVDDYYDHIDEEYIENFIFVKNDSKFMLVSYDYNSKDETFAMSKLKPVLDSVKFTDREAVSDYVFHRITPFTYVINNWGDHDDDYDPFESITDDGYEQCFNADFEDEFCASNFYDNRMYHYCYADIKPGQPDVNIYIGAKKSSDYVSRSIENIAKEEYPLVKLDEEDGVSVSKILSEEKTTFNGYEAYHYDIDYKYDEDFDYGVHEDCNVDIYFVKNGDTVLCVITHLNNEFLDFLNSEIQPVLDSIRFEKHALD